MKTASLLFLLSVFLFAKEPDWVTKQGKSSQYPELYFLTGYGIATTQNGVSEEQALYNAVASAQKNLIEKIRVTLQATTIHKSEEIGEKFSSFFSSVTQATSNLEIQGLEQISYVDDDKVYAFVFVRRKVLQATYNQTVEKLTAELTTKITTAQTYERRSEPTPALNEYLSCLPLARQLEEASSILSCISLSSTLEHLSSIASSNEISISQIREAITRLIQRPILTTEDLAWYLVYQLQEQTRGQFQEKPSVLSIPLNYQDTPLGSSFSRYFNVLLEQKFVELAKWNAVHNADAQYVLAGSYWEQQGVVKCIVNLRNVKNGKILASAEATVPLRVVESSGKSLKPENITSALLNQKIFASGESAGGGLSVEAWTNKQTAGNLFTNGERMTVTVRVNMPCYLRFIYLDAAGNKILLLDNYYIDQSKVNLAYEIPQPFECAPPFGSELLQIFAQTEKFAAVSTKNENGFDLLQDDVQNVVAQTRGMKKVQPSTLQAETRLTITTMKE